MAKQELAEMKGMRNPPQPVRLVCEAMCVLRGLPATLIKDGSKRTDYWETSKRMLADMTLLD